MKKKSKIEMKYKKNNSFIINLNKYLNGNIKVLKSY